MSGVELVRIFVTVVDRMICIDNMENIVMYIVTNSGQYLNFNTNDFRFHLVAVLSEDKHQMTLNAQNKANLDKMTKEVMQMIKKLGWIVCDKDKFTNIQKINGCPRRVITVKKDVYDCLRMLDWASQERDS